MMKLRSTVLLFFSVSAAAYGLIPRLKSHRVTMVERRHAILAGGNTHHHQQHKEHHPPPPPTMQAATLDAEAAIPAGAMVDYGVWILPRNDYYYYNNYYNGPSDAAVAAAPRPSLQDMLRTFLDWYTTSLKQNPLSTRAISGAVVSVVGDVISQSVMALLGGGHGAGWDVQRTISFGLIGMGFSSQFLSVWYSAVAKFGARLQQRRQWSDRQRVMAELALDQTVGVMMYYPAFFFAFEFVAAVVQNRAFAFPSFTLGGFAPIFSAICANYAFWPWSQWFSFTFVPQQLRVLYSSLAAIVWNVFFCSMVAGAA